MLNSLLGYMFGCSHRNTTFPLTPKHRVPGAATRSTPRQRAYVACLDCGKEFNYNWEEMRIEEGGFQAPAAGRVTKPESLLRLLRLGD